MNALNNIFYYTQQKKNKIKSIGMKNDLKLISIHNAYN